MEWKQWLQSKTFWAGVGLVGLGVYQATQGGYDQAVQSLLAALAAWGLRSAVAANGRGE